MILWAQELTMMHQAILLPPWHTVLMGQGWHIFCTLYKVILLLVMLIFFISFMCDIIMDIFVSSLNNIGCSHVGQIKKVIHTWWSGMKVKEP